MHMSAIAAMMAITTSGMIRYSAEVGKDTPFYDCFSKQALESRV